MKKFTEMTSKSCAYIFITDHLFLSNQEFGFSVGTLDLPYIRFYLCYWGC